MSVSELQATRRWADRPADRVRQFLDDHMASLPASGRFRLPTARVLAQQLDVSPQTILNVYRQYAAEGRVETRAGDGTFVVREEAPSPSPERGRLCLGMPYRGLVNSRLSDNWSRAVYASLLEAAVGMQPEVTLLPLQTSDTGEYCLELLSKQILTVDGLILQPSMHIHEIIQGLRRFDRPVVTLNLPHDTALTHFVSPDFFTASHTIGRAWAAVGKRRILLVSTRELSTSVSTRQRLFGLISGLGERYPSDLTLRIELAYGSGIDHGATLGRKLLEDDQPLPDAIYCIGDNQALGIHQALTEQGISIPDEVSLIGGSGLDMAATTCPGLTRTFQNMPHIARALLEMLAKCVQQPKVEISGQFIKMPLLGGSTTTEAENQILQIQSGVPPAARLA